MQRTIGVLLVVASLTLWGAATAGARGFGGTRGGYHGSGTGSSGGHYSNGYHQGGQYAHGPEGEEATRSASSYHSYEGPHGTSVEHGTAAVQGEAAGPGGAAAGGKVASGTKVTGPGGNTYTHETTAGRGAAAGPEGAEAGRYGATGGYSAAHGALPTDAGYGAVARTPAATGYSGYHQTAAVNGNVAAARGATVRNSFTGYGMYGSAWHTANPNAWTAGHWAAGGAWTPATWPAVGATLGWGAAQPVSYNYGTNVTYQGDQVCFGNQPVATADEFYQQASAIAQTAPPAETQTDQQWLPLGVFALVQNDQAEPHFIIQLAVNKAGTIAGNYTDMLSGVNATVHGSVDMKTQRAAWTVGANKSTVCETGLYNLTRDEAHALIHIGKDKTQQWLLVRLQQPQKQDSQ
jgi:hypothetical protein